MKQLIQQVKTGPINTAEVSYKICHGSNEFFSLIKPGIRSWFLGSAPKDTHCCCCHRRR